MAKTLSLHEFVSRRDFIHRSDVEFDQHYIHYYGEPCTNEDRSTDGFFVYPEGFLIVEMDTYYAVYANNQEYNANIIPEGLEELEKLLYHTYLFDYGEDTEEVTK